VTRNPFTSVYHTYFKRVQMKMSVHFFSSFSTLCISIVFMAGCEKNDTVKTSRALPEKNLSDKLFASSGSQPSRIQSLRLDQDTVYLITESISRQAGEQLIIEEGTLIKLSPGVGISIEPGAIISANGSPTRPIIFTTNLPSGSKGAQWNGISIKGKSFNNASGTNGDPTDNSGSMQYVRIEFANLSVTSAGSGTYMDHIQVSYAGAEPAFVFSGGNFNARYLISYASDGAADFYITNGYQGKLQFLHAQRHPFYGRRASRPAATMSGVYISNSEVNNLRATPQTRPQISNLTVVGPNDQDGQQVSFIDTTASFSSAALVTTGNALFNIRNAAFLGFPSSAWIIADSSTAYNVNFRLAEFGSSIVQSTIGSRVYYIRPNLYRRYTSVDFIAFMENPVLKNSTLLTAEEFLMTDPFNYEQPLLTPKEGSILQNSADFSGSVFSDPFFEKVNFRGAYGNTNWASIWTNFIPLKTRYNEPQ
jgi:hypothetical protein